MPPPSSGGLTVLQMLGLLERFPLGDAAQGYGFGSPNTLHVMIEAMRLAFADRAVWIGDEDFVPVPRQGPAGSRLPRHARGPDQARPPHGHAAGRRPAALGHRHRRAAEAVAHAREESPHTTHFSVVDRWGNVVSYTSTIEFTWGSGITVPGYGFLLNNELTDFNFVPAADAAAGNPGANDVAPGKRPRSSMAPTLLFRDGKPVAAYGSPGGATIINSVLNVTLNLIDHGMTMQQAIDAPRLSVTHAAGTGQLRRRRRRSCSRVSASPRRMPCAGWGTSAWAKQGRMAAGRRSARCKAVVIDLATGAHHGAADPRREGTVIQVEPVQTLPEPAPD